MIQTLYYTRQDFFKMRRDPLPLKKSIMQMHRPRRRDE